MDEFLIKDIPSIQKSLEDSKNISALKRVMPFLRPFLKLLGADIAKIDAALADVDKLVERAEELATIPDRFNEQFAAQGWIIYDLMKFDVAKAAIEKAESNDLDSAESDLVYYYSGETVRWKLRTMNSLEAFRPRMSLAQKALIDYEEERYHACIPLVLLLLDGLVNELHEKRRGFFSEEVNLTAWDSIAAHSLGLNVLSGIFRTGRYKTTTEEITIPYRNGILHGMDLGYDNRIVAAKAWAALFATRDWAIKAERGELAEPPQKPGRSWREIFRQIRDTKELEEHLKQWKTRDILVGVDVPEAGEFNEYDEGTPERQLVEFLTYWKSRNYGYMAKCIYPGMGPPDRRTPRHVREVFEYKHLNCFKLIEIVDEAAAITEIQTKIISEEFDTTIEKLVRFRMVNTDNDGTPAIRGKPNSRWSVVNWEVY